MKKIYVLPFLLALLFTFSNSYGQYRLSVKTPDSLKGDYLLTFGNIGRAHTTEISGELYLQSGLACDTIVSPDGKDKIVLIDRGTCTFDVKAIAAVRAGAKACIICNNSGAVPTVIAGRPTLPIPVYMATQADCNLIKANLAKAKLNGGISLVPCSSPRVYSTDVFWGNKPGEGDFSNGLGGWSTVSLTENATRRWTHHPIDLPIFGAFNGNAARIASPTACNGVATINFVSYSVVDNPSLAQPYPVYISELISPTVSCVGKTGVSVEFYQLINRLNRNLFYSISVDDGATWSERVEVPTQNAVNTTPNTELRTIPIPQFNNQARCKFKFIAEGDFYFYSIDDVVFTTKKIYDVKINRDWYAGAPNFATPFNQTTPFPLIVDIENLGNQVLKNSKVIATVTKDSDKSVIYRDSIVYPDIPIGTKAENAIFNKRVTLPQEIGNYTLTYSVVADSTKATNETVFSTPIQLSKNIFSKLPIPAPGTSGVLSGWRAGGVTNFFTASSYYRVPKGTWPNAKPITIDKAFTGVSVNPTNATANTSAILSVDVYEWTNPNDSVVKPADRKRIATGTQVILNDTASIEIPLFDPNDNQKKVVLNNKGDLHLIVSTSISPLDDGNTTWFMASRNPADLRESSGQYNSFATSFADANVGGNGHNCFFGSSAGDTPESRILEPTSLVVYNPLILQEVDLTSVDLIDKAIETKIYPNPASDKLTIDLNLNENREFVFISMYNMDGKLVLAEKYLNVSSKMVNLDVSDLPTGIYNLRLTTDKGYSSQKVSIVK